MGDNVNLIDVSTNRLGCVPDDISCVYDLLDYNPNLQTFKCSNNQYTGQHEVFLNDLSCAVAEHRNLKSLEFRQNDLSGIRTDCFEEVLENIASCKTLEHLDLSHCKLSDQHIPAIETLLHSSSLQTLDLGGNAFSEQAEETLQQKAGNIKISFISEKEQLEYDEYDVEPPLQPFDRTHSIKSDLSSCYLDGGSSLQERTPNR